MSLQNIGVNSVNRIHNMWMLHTVVVRQTIEEITNYKLDIKASVFSAIVMKY